MFGKDKKPEIIPLNVVNKGNPDFPFSLKINGFSKNQEGDLTVKVMLKNISKRIIDSFQVGIILKDKFGERMDFLVGKYQAPCVPENTVQVGSVFHSIRFRDIGYVISYPMKVRFSDGEILDFYDPETGHKNKNDNENKES